jgi:hypothetical protein
MRDVISPNNTARGDGHPRRGETGSMHRSPSVERSDSGHLGQHSAGAGWTPVRLRPDAAPPEGPRPKPVPALGGLRDVIE